MKKDYSLQALCLLMSVVLLCSMRTVTVNYTVPPPRTTAVEEVEETRKPRKNKGKN